MRLTREFYRPTPKTADNIHLRTYEDITGSEVYTYDRNGKPCAMVFGGRRSKPDWQFRFFSNDHRDQKIAEWLDNQRSRASYTAKRRKERSKPHGFKPGQLFYISWGYDQTNIDYYMLTETRGKTQGYIVPVSGTTVRTATATDYVKPDPDCIRDWDVLLGVESGDTERGKWKKLNPNGFSIDGRYLASPCDADTERYQTAAGYGH